MEYPWRADSGVCGRPVALAIHRRTRIREDPEVGIIVLGAGVSSEGPGPLVTQLVARQGGSLPVPVTIVPGSLSKEAIIAVS